MFNKRKTKSTNLVEGFLILFFIILVIGILDFIGERLVINAVLYNGLVASAIIFTIVIGSVTIFQFIKMKYVEAAKTEVKEEIEKYKVKSVNKIAETNNRMAYFEVNYSKKLKKIMKEYAVKTKEIEDIKKELNMKLFEMDKKAAQLEMETCIMKAERLSDKKELDIEQIKHLYVKIIEINDRYPEICDEKVLSLAYSNIKDA